MKTKISFKLIFIIMIIIDILGCSSGGSPQTPPADNQIPDYTGHLVLLSGSFEIDTGKMEIRNTPSKIDPIHDNFENFLAGKFDVEITSVSDDLVTLKMSIENPYNADFYDMRIIFSSLNGKNIVNPDGYTNFYSSSWNEAYNPFFYFAKESGNHLFPKGQGASDSGEITVSIDGQTSPEVTYIIESSLKENTKEPIAIENITTRGELAPIGGAMIVQCDVRDWQNNISDVKILANDFFPEDIQMILIPQTGSFAGTLINSLEVVPGDYDIWILAKSSDCDELSLIMPYTIRVPMITYPTPQLLDLPYVDLDYRRNNETEEITEIMASLHVLSDNETEFCDNIHFYSSCFNYRWEPIYPLQSEGEWGKTGNQYPCTNYHLPPYPSSDRYLFEVEITGKHDTFSSNALVWFPTEIELPPVIINGPNHVSTINEGSWAVFTASISDPNRIQDNRYLSVDWDDNRFSGTDSWLGGNNKSLVVYWNAPEVDEHEIAEISFTVFKDTGYYQTSETASFEIMIFNVRP
jgi:hypothetical protein